MGSKKPSGGRRSSVTPILISTIPAIPAVIKAIEELIDKLPDIPSKVDVSSLCDPSIRLNLVDATKALTDMRLKPVASNLALEEADPKYKDCFDSQVVYLSFMRKKKLAVGTVVIVKYISQEVIDESIRLFEELEKQKAEANRIKIEKHDQQKEQRQRAVADATDKVKRLPGKILHHKEKGPESKDL